MVMSITGLGRVWRRRFGKDPGGPRRFARAAYYKTSGVSVDETILTRSKVAGCARFNSAGGFNQNYRQRMINRVFGCDKPRVWQEQNKVFFKYMLVAPRESDLFLVVARQSEIGRLHVGDSGWKSDDGLLISFSEWHDEQEFMLLLLVYGWMRSGMGTFTLQPLCSRPWIARLQLGS